VTDSDSKMVVKSRFVCTFAGDDCAKSIAMAIVAEAGDLGFENSAKFIEEVKKSLGNHTNKPGLFRKTQYRKILWIQALGGSAFSIWAASYCRGVNGPVFDLIAPQVQNSIFAGNEGNPARYFVDHYYKKNPMKTVSGLKNMAAHVIRTGHIFNTAGVEGLEMVVGENGCFTKVQLDELQKIDNEISRIHAAIDAYFVV